MGIEKSPLTISTAGKVAKRIFDLVLFFLLIIPFCLLIILISLGIVLTTREYPIFIDRRMGKNGKIITVFKLRTMVKNPETLLDCYLRQFPEKKAEWIRYKKIKGNDPRITPIGKFLRKFSLDELPQIFNVLQGNMNFVGPRPYMTSEKNDMGPFRDFILSVKPGVTGLWQIRGRNALAFSERLNLDVHYIQNWSLGMDLRILLKTIWIVILGKESY